MRAVAPAIIVTIASLCGAPQVQAQEPPPAPAAGEPAAQRPIVSPGKAKGFTKQTYPFDQDAGPVGGLEPLLLPWSGLGPVEYAWSGSAFERR